MRLRTALNRNIKDERGSFSVEAILMFPLLAWAFLAMYVFFEGLRESNINVKAAYTVADLLSREQDDVTNELLIGTQRVYEWLSRSRQPVRLRVSVVTYDDVTEEHNRLWSREITSEGVGPGLTQADIATVVSPHVPIMASSAQAIVVESWSTYVPVIEMGLTTTEFYNIVVTAPRFAGQLGIEGLGDNTGLGHDDDTAEDNTIPDT
ncbi:hypothetical protein N9L47_06775 [Rhodobacteraceae bacterium]|nr:hypothetical protein [Paracoccaceae bacterium]